MIGGFVEREPATAAQQRLWLVDQQCPRGIEFSFPYLFELHGPCDPARLADAIAQVVARHAPLRTTFALHDETLEQHIHPAATACFALVEPSDADEADALIADEVTTPFDLARDVPLRVRLYRIGEREHRLLVNVHHVATDGLSMQVMLDEIAAAHRGDDLPELLMSSAGEGPVPPNVLDFWQRTTTGAMAPAGLPGERSPRRPPAFSGQWFDLELSAADTTGLDRLARASGGSLYSALFALLAVVLGRRTGQTDLVLGVPFSGRRSDQERLIGFFVNLLPVRLRVDERMAPRQLCAAATDAVTAVLEHSTVPLDRIVDRLPRPEGGFGALLDVTLTEEQTPRLELSGIEVVHHDLRLDVARYRLAVDYRRLPSGGLRFEVSYAKDRLTRAQVAELMADVATLVRTAAAAPDRPLATQPMTGGPVSVLVEPEPGTMPEALATLWRRAVERHGGRVAVIDRAGELTFAGLDRATAALARRLRGRGLSPGQRVALSCARNRDFFVALLAVLRCGATPVLLDAGHPAGRRAELVRRSGAVITLSSAPGGPDEMPVSSTADDDEDSIAWTDRPDGSLAYVVCTSGSTGTPKCVGVEDRNLLRLLASLDALGFADPSRRLALNASLGFDASVQQWVRVFAGCPVVILDEQARLDPAELVGHVIRHDVAELDISPRHLDAILDPLVGELCRAGRSLRLLVGGEALPAPLWTRLRAATEEGLLVCWNMYGPTETTVDASVCPLAMSEEPTIGLPLPGVCAYVLDEWWRPVPAGSPGQLCLAGDGVGRGYLDAPGMTARTFVADPVAADGSRMYATGDRVRIRPDGLLEFLGRIDDQVKINGHRVEPHELEVVVLGHSGVTACAVLADPGPDPQLTLFAVCPQPILDSLPDWLAARVPGYLVPRRLHRVATIPLGPQGKVDRAALQEATGRLVSAERPVPAEPGPRGAAQVIAEAWREVLRTAEVGEDDDFFSLGGHSLLAIRVIARVRKEMSVTLPISSIFTFPVLRDLAAHVELLRSRT
ncbi:non-ribosomal peptide synthetase [Amycolatopsis saalfeldensis]|uniref:Amino acid adenylation domain-containing protein n=1 Tax=Amycolatopsis saalfeldensis TaxID=394193 RepID=A0A1H8YA72_9PSEU|nr:AMP-binding protein [Amycolatopsis saalfeldensis]SEP48388.1 amino acid adenylation domain-containing protein [Amycolatopsis saalfeldensis]